MVSAGIKSGTMHTAEYTVDYGRDLFADIFVNNDSDEKIAFSLFDTKDTSVKTSWFPSASSIDDLKLSLATATNGAGNSLIFQFGFNSNITATIPNFTTENNKRLKVPVPYCKSSGDYKGFLRNCSFDLYGSNIDFGDSIAYPIVSTSNITVAGITVIRALSGTKYISIPSLLVLKDPAEILQFTYQIHIVSNNNNVIVGRKLAENNRMINNNSSKPVVYEKSYRTSRFDNYKLIDGTASTITYSCVASGTSYTLKFYDSNSTQLSSSNKPTKDLYLVDSTTKEIYLIIKKEFFDTHDTIYFNFLKNRTGIINNY